MNTKLMLPALALALASTLAGTRLHAQEPGAGLIAPAAPAIKLTQAGLAERYETLGKLIDGSSSARQIERSDTPEGRQLHQAAREARAQARTALDGGKLELADVLLRQATQSMLQAVGKSDPDEVNAGKLKTDFDQLRESVRALMHAGQRFAGENRQAKPEFGKAQALLEEADALAAVNRHGEGKLRLDLAYLLVKVTLRAMGDGRTVTDTSKNFATPADEYRYEQGRNDEYQELIAGVIKGQGEPGWQASADLGQTLRAEADRIAGAGDHAAALRKIDESTRQLKAILRRAGFPIV